MKIYDEFCPWPYVEAYGMVKAPKIKKPRKSRKVQVSKSWKKLQRTQPRDINPEK
jgi:hypothetical protein